MRQLGILEAALDPFCLCNLIEVVNYFSSRLVITAVDRMNEPDMIIQYLTTYVFLPLLTVHLLC